MKLKKSHKEILFQIFVHIVVFVFYAFERNQTQIETYKYFSFLNYAITAAVINYFVLPFFYKRKNVLEFIAIVGVGILLAATIEELVIEKIFFTGVRADTFKMFMAFVDIIPVVMILTGVKFAWDAVLKQNEVDRLSETVRESELQFLKSQINPHFLFNNLNNLYAYALEGSHKTPQIILELSGLLRYMLYECKEEFVPLSKEIEQLRNYVNLNELQIEERGDVSFNVNASVGSYKIAPLIMMVFVENAFKHSQSSQSDEIMIDINLDISDDGKLTFMCSNSFQEVSNNDRLEKGIGLQNVRKRLDLIYPDAHFLKIENEDNNYVVVLTMELKKNRNL